MVQVCAHLWAMQQLLFWRAFPCSQDAQLLVHKHMPRAGFLYEYGRPAGAARARVNRDSRNELMELHATQKVCHRRVGDERAATRSETAAIRDTNRARELSTW